MPDKVDFRERKLPQTEEYYIMIKDQSNNMSEQS